MSSTERSQSRLKKEIALLGRASAGTTNEYTLLRGREFAG